MYTLGSSLDISANLSEFLLFTQFLEYYFEICTDRLLSDPYPLSDISGHLYVAFGIATDAEVNNIEESA